MENYKEKYEQALNRAKVINPGTADYEVAVKIFPELKESEDERNERIRKALKSYFDSEISDYGNIEWMKGIRYGEVIAWLEKQGEEKTADNIEQKFHAGDFITDGKRIFQIEETVWERNNRNDGITYCESLIVNLRDGITYANDTNLKEYHLWTIQDAKEGDVLSNKDMVLIFKCFEEPSYRQHIIAYIGLDTSGNIQVTNGSWNLGLDGANPATKEQRDLLFQKMKEAGYEWNTEKKELKKIAQKPAAYFYCKYGGVMPLCSDCKRNHLNSKYKTEEIETWMIPALRCTKQCFSYIQQKPTSGNLEPLTFKRN